MIDNPPSPATTCPSSHLSRQFAAVKRAAATGPVLITERGRPAYVVMDMDEYHRLAACDKPQDAPGQSAVRTD